MKKRQKSNIIHVSIIKGTSLILLSFFLFLSGCSILHSQHAVSRLNTEKNSTPQIAYQYSTIQALSQGIYDGDLTFNQLREKGNFGLGTFNRVDGEMIALDGRFYQIKSNGSIKQVDGTAQTPFAIVTHFQSDKKIPLSKISNLKSLTSILNKQIKSKQNNFFFIRIDGTFSFIKTRSVAKQEKPYQPLVKVVNQQKTFNFKNIKGTIVGVYTPAYASQINVSGFHFHFISQNRKAGGHVLDLALQQGSASFDTIPSVTVEMPQTKPFQQADLTTSSQKDIDKIEKNPTGK